MPTNSGDRLTITGRPWLAWLMGVLFSAAGVYMALALEEARWFGLIFLAAGLGMLLLFGRVWSLTLDRTEGTATVRQIGLLRSTRQVPLAELSGARVQRNRSSRSGATYRVALVLRSGETLPLNGTYESGWSTKNAQAERINDFLGARPVPAGAFAEVPAALGGEGVTGGIAWQVEARTGDETTPVTRWHAEAAGLEGGFLLLLQTHHKMGGTLLGGGVMAALARKAYEAMLSAYGWGPNEIGGLSEAVSVEGQDPALAEHFLTFTSQREGARRWLNTEACRILAAWAERHPAGATTGGLGSLCVVAAPKGLWISVLSPKQDPARIEDMTAMGVALVCAQALPVAEA